MEDDLNYLQIEEDIFFLQMEDNLKVFLEIEDKLIFWPNWRRPQYSCEWKTTSKIKNKQCNLKQIKTEFYAVLDNSIAQLLVVQYLKKEKTLILQVLTCFWYQPLEMTRNSF